MALVTFAVLIITAGVRATPGVLMVPLEAEFGWTTAAISSAIAVNIALFGLIGPFAASAMNRFGHPAYRACRRRAPRRVRCDDDANADHLADDAAVGPLRGTGTGVTALVLAATVTTRWFETRRGLVLGMLSAANATGQLVFLPILARMIASHGWRSARARTV